MSFQLENDSQSSVQDHLNELTSRVTLILFFASITTIAWMTQVDSLLDSLLLQLNPCESECLNLFDPAKWSAVRWMTAALLGIITVMPLALYQMWIFSKSGLLPNERVLMKTWFFAGILSTLVAVITTIGLFFPMIFDTGHQTHESMKLDARYDAVHMLSIVIAVIWTEIIVACAILAMMLAGILGMLNEDTADWWRIRIYGLVLLLLLASLPEFGGLAIILATLSVSLIEVCSTKWLNGKVPLFQGYQPIMDAEGELRNMLLVDCSCNGSASPIPRKINSSIPVHAVNSLCTSSKERELVLEKVIQYRLSDVIISGCSVEALPDSFRDNCDSLSCSLRNLNLDRSQSHRKTPSLLHLTEIELSIASLHDPWPKSKIHERIISVLKGSGVNELILDTRKKNQSSDMKLKPDQVVLRIDSEIASKVQPKLEAIGVTTILM